MYMYTQLNNQGKKNCLYMLIQPYVILFILFVFKHICSAYRDDQ